jgi:hypothetical protein
VPQVARLHCLSLYGTGSPPSERLQDYYREVFFRNPWFDPQLPSLVYRTNQGEVVGFMGRIPRPMAFSGRTIRAAIAHRLMVAPGSGRPLAAVRLVRQFLAGPQDLAISDGANDKGRQFWEGCGGAVSPLYSLGWIWPLRPSRYLLSILTRGRLDRTAGMAFRPICSAIDLVASRKWKVALSDAPFAASQIDMDASTLIACVNETAADFCVRPDYDEQSMGWLWQRLNENTDRGRLQGKVVMDRRGRLAGGFLCYLRKGGFGEVVFLAARHDSVEMVLDSLFHHALRERLVCLRGRLEPRFLLGLMRHECILKRHSWGLVHARDPQIMKAVESGEAFISGLEGELWLRSPRDSL